jgi:hypothetical protein
MLLGGPALGPFPSPPKKNQGSAPSAANTLWLPHKGSQSSGHSPDLCRFQQGLRAPLVPWCPAQAAGGIRIHRHRKQATVDSVAVHTCEAQENSLIQEPLAAPNHKGRQHCGKQVWAPRPPQSLRSTLKAEEEPSQGLQALDGAQQGLAPLALEDFRSWVRSQGVGRHYLPTQPGVSRPQASAQRPQ